MNFLEQKTALVTGAGRGIGRAIAVALGARGVRVCCVSRTKSEVAESVQEIERDGGRGIAVTANVTRERELQDAFAAAQEAFGAVHIVIANAGTNLDRNPIESSCTADFVATVEVNLIGAYLTVKTAIPYLRDSGGGHIVSVGSGLGLKGTAGTGGGIASFMAYDLAKRRSKNPELFGKGSLEGVASAEAANNATTGGALVPMLTLGIPGDPSTAVLMSAFMIQGLQPGPLLLPNEPRTIFSLFAGLLIANVLMFGFGMIGIRAFSKVVRIPIRILAPTVLVLCFVGSYAIANSILDVAVMLLMGGLGYLMRKFGFPGAPLVIGLILGPINEAALRRALSASRGNWMVFFENPIFLFFFALTIMSFVLPLVRKKLKPT